MGKIVNRKELSDILGVTPQTLTNWLKEGLPVIQDNGTNAGKMYDTSSVIAWMVDRRSGGGGGGVSAISQKDQEARIAKERADNLEIKNAILRREYAPITVISSVLSRVCAQVAATLDSLPLNMKRKIPSLTQTDIEIVRREVVKCQNAAATSADVLERELEEVFKNSRGLPE